MTGTEQPRTAAGWRHAKWCRFEQGAEVGDCTCGLSTYRAEAASPSREALAAALEQVALTDMWDESPQPDGSIVASVNRYRMADAILAALPGSDEVQR